MSEVSFEIRDGIFYKTTTKICTNPDSVLKALISNQFIYLGNFIDNIHCGFNEDGRVILCKRLSKLTIDMRFEVEYERTTDGINITHVPSVTCGQFVKVDWEIPETIRMFFIFDHRYWHLIAYDVAGERFFRMPLPNVYRTGRLCTGYIPDDERKPVVEMFSECHDKWSSNQYNGDLYGNYEDGSYRWKIDALKRLIRYDESMHQLDPSIDISFLPDCSPEVNLSIVRKIMGV